MRTRWRWLPGVHARKEHTIPCISPAFLCFHAPAAAEVANIYEVRLRAAQHPAAVRDDGMDVGLREQNNAGAAPEHEERDGVLSARTARHRTEGAIGGSQRAKELPGRKPQATFRELQAYNRSALQDQNLATPKPKSGIPNRKLGTVKHTTISPQSDFCIPISASPLLFPLPTVQRGARTAARSAHSASCQKGTVPS